MYKVSSEKVGASTEKSLWAVLDELGKRLGRIESALRGRAKTAEGDGESFRFGDGTVSRKMFGYFNKREEFVRLSPRELRLLEMFAEHPNEVLARDMLLSRIWGLDYYGNTRTLDQHIGRIRQKLGRDGSLIVSINRVGYAYQPLEMHSVKFSPCAN